MPLEAAATAQSVYAGSKWTVPGSRPRGGITTIVDHGIRCARADGFYPSRCHRYSASGLCPRPVPMDLQNYATSVRTPDASASVDAGLEAARDYRSMHCKAFDRIYPSLACGTVQSNSRTMIKALSPFRRDEDILFQIHANEHMLRSMPRSRASGGARSNCTHIGALGRNTLIARDALAASPRSRC